jgi:hypothetical protein
MYIRVYIYIYMLEHTHLTYLGFLGGFRVTIATNFGALTHYMRSRMRQQSSVLLYRVYSVSTDFILMWIREV